MRTRNRLVASMLVLAMLISALTALTFGMTVTAAEGEEDRASIYSVDEYQYPTTFYQSNWGGEDDYQGKLGRSVGLQ